LENHRGPFFSVAGPTRLCLGPIQWVKPAHTVCFLGTLPRGPQHLTAPPVSLTSSRAGNRYAPDPLPHRRSSPAKFPSTGRPPITTPHHKDAHMCACHLEPLCRLRCSVASNCHWPLLCCRPSLLHPGYPCQELNCPACLAGQTHTTESTLFRARRSPGGTRA
jgi:hypothetical protein